MVKKYIELPLNFLDIEEYVIAGATEAVDAFFAGNNYFFYDTCSILHHSNLAKRKAVIDYFKSKSATIIITRTVLMELSANSFKVHGVQIQYFKEMFESGLKIIIFNEELIFDCLKEALSISNEDANKLLGYAAKEISKTKSKTYEILMSMDQALSNKLKGQNPGNKELFSTFFKYARSLKTEGDSLAEELMLVCIVVLSRIPIGRYILVSDDFRIRHQVISVKDYTARHHKKSEPYQLTTASLAFRMYKDSVITTRGELLDLIQCVSKDSIPVYFVGECDINQEKGILRCEDLVDRIMNEKEFRIIY